MTTVFDLAVGKGDVASQKMGRALKNATAEVSGLFSFQLFFWTNLTTSSSVLFVQT
jgi:hypothetical protein